MTWTILYSIQDEKGKTSTTEVNLPTATTYADAAIMAAEMAEVIDTLINGAITRIGIVSNVSLPGTIKTAPAANSDVEEGARFQFKTTNGFYSGLRLPTFDENRIVAGSRAVDLADAGVNAFVVAMVSGLNIVAAGGSGTISPCDKRNEDLTSLEFAREQFLSSRG